MTAQDRVNVGERRRNPVYASWIPVRLMFARVLNTLRVLFAPPLGHALPRYDEKANKHA